ncbi:hypothetical protein EDWATA_02504 [Edwardsiella tarda ATCC 23685]|uniref:Uncharacterized protein n=1 Tax=Edwardsiella tarda ATCC 23685 TaxID=500638 RepID=D4F6X0_EDWTA|nr:hypothetical protein EDWATA_02504 [Edwardsiella tarda ATCC 23685]
MDFYFPLRELAHHSSGWGRARDLARRPYRRLLGLTAENLNKKRENDTKALPQGVDK